MSLGTFGGSAPPAVQTPGGGSASSGDLMSDALTRQLPSPQGMPAITPQLFLAKANYGLNLLKNGGFESWPYGAASDPGPWSGEGAGGTVAKETTNIKDGAASCTLTSALNNVKAETQFLTISAAQNPTLRGEWFTFSCWVLCSTGGRAFLRINDGVTTFDSPFHSGNGGFEYLTVSMQLASTATKCGAEVRISSGAAISATFDSAMLVWGNSPIAFTEHPNDRLVAIDNFLNETTNALDHLVYRCEIGRRTTLNTGAVTVTFATQFGTMKTIVVTPTNSVAYFCSIDSVGVSSFTISTFDNTNARQGVVCHWIAIGTT